MLSKSPRKVWVRLWYRNLDCILDVDRTRDARVPDKHRLEHPRSSFVCIQTFPAVIGPFSLTVN